VRTFFLVALLVGSSLLAGCSGLDAVPEEALGCTYADATNYNESAVVDDGSCVYPEPPEPVLGCMYADALNYNAAATEDDGSCRYPVVPDPTPGCMYSDAYNYDANATEDDGSCVYDSDGDGILDEFEEAGCTSASANNHNLSATEDDGSCDYDLDDDGVADWAEIVGCTDSNASNYDAGATDANDESCTYGYVMTLDEFLNAIDDPENSTIAEPLLENASAVVRIWVVELVDEEEEGFGNPNANTTGIEVYMGHDPQSEVLYERVLFRIGGITFDQTTVQGPDGINYRNGNDDSGAWYYARDEVYEYENPFAEGEENGPPSPDDEGDEEESCDLEELDSAWASDWSVSSANGVHTATGSNGTFTATLVALGDPPVLSSYRIEEIDGLVNCGVEVLDPADFDLSINTNYPRTSITMLFENEIEEGEDPKTWTAEVSGEHFEEANLNEIEIRVVYQDDEGQVVVAASALNQGTTSHTDDCYQWTLSWSDVNNDGYVSANDTYSVTRTDRVFGGCSDDDEYRNKEFEVMFWDNWADLPVGGVFLPGFHVLAAVSMLGGASLYSRRHNS
jgi:hypothetical protein